MKFVRWMILVPASLIVVGVAVTEIKKSYWDWKVGVLCKRDGGLTVYQTVIITEEQYIRNDGHKGFISVLSARTTKPNHEFYWDNRDIVIQKSNPLVVRSEYVTYRKSDGKPLGKWVTYSRVGGDFPTGFHHSSFSCRDVPNFRDSVSNKIFLIEME